MKKTKAVMASHDNYVAFLRRLELHHAEKKTQEEEKKDARKARMRGTCKVLRERSGED